jgi:hypothetical protein
MKREDVYKLIDGERYYQQVKWNESTTDSKEWHSSAEWLVYMQDYLTEAMHLAARNPDPAAITMIMSNIRKITAMGVAAMEQIDTLSREREILMQSLKSLPEITDEDLIRKNIKSIKLISEGQNDPVMLISYSSEQDTRKITDVNEMIEFTKTLKQ